MNADVVNTIVTMIGSLGFPIVACIALFSFINKTLKEIKEALENNTNVMTQLAAKIDGIK